MEFDFTTVLDRRGRDALAVDVIPYPDVTVQDGLRPIPMWVADMSFPTAPSIVKAVSHRLDHPNFGYFQLPDAYYDAIIRWQAERHGVKGLLKSHIGYENGVLGGVGSALRTLTGEGDPILVHEPTYIGFLHLLHDIGRTVITSPLTRDAQGVWRMDYADMEAKIRTHGIKVAIFCSPHNPCGRVWEREEIERAMDVYARCGCTVISDEIWADLTFEGHRHIPTQSIGEDARMRTVAFYAPSKTFSLAGLIGSYHLQRRSAHAHRGDRSIYLLQFLQRAFSARAARRIQSRRRALGRRTAHRAVRQSPVRQGLYGNEFRRRIDVSARRHVYAVSELQSVVRCPRHFNGNAFETRRGSGRDLAERRRLRRSRLHPSERRTAVLARRRSDDAAENARVSLNLHQNRAAAVNLQQLFFVCVSYAAGASASACAPIEFATIALNASSLRSQ